MTETTNAALAAELQSAAHDFLERAWSAERLREWRGNPALLANVWRGAVSQGWFAAGCAETVGGLGVGVTGLVGLMEERGARLVPGPWIHTLAARAAMPEHLAQLPEDAGIALLGIVGQPSDPGPASLTLRDSCVFGTAVGLDGGPAVSSLVALCNAGERPAMVLIDANQPRVKLEGMAREEVISGERTVTADGAEVKAILADGKDVEPYAKELRSICQLLVAGTVVGMMREVLDMSIGYARIREQFGRPIGGFQAIKHRLADMYIWTSVARTQVIGAARAYDRGDPSEVLSALAYCLSFGRRACENSLQVHGGIGFTADLPLHLYLKYLIFLRRQWGTERTLFARIGRDVLNQADEGPDQAGHR